MSTKEKLESALNQIGWTLRHMGCEHYRPVDLQGRLSLWELWLDELSYRTSFGEIRELASINLASEDADIRLIDGKTVACGSNKHFVLFMNHQKEKENIPRERSDEDDLMGFTNNDIF